jgi:hypothetical protein
MSYCPDEIKERVEMAGIKKDELEGKIISAQSTIIKTWGKTGFTPRLLNRIIPPFRRNLYFPADLNEA